MTLTRRRLLVLAGAVGGAFFAPGDVLASPCAARFTDEIDRGRLEAGGIIPYDLGSLRDVVTPAADFFVRSHFGNVLLQEARLAVGGRVARPGVRTLEDLRRLPRREQLVTLECAGNAVVQGQGLVSTARFGGCALVDFLDAVGVSSKDDEIVFTAADGMDGGGPYARSMKVREAIAAGAFLAWEMNGAPLRVEHGAPLRLVVPGWYGMASVKWLVRIELRAEPFTGKFQRSWYVNRVRGADGSVRIEPVTRTLVKSVGATVETRGSSIRLRGASWGGEGEITRVDVTLDGGRTWSASTLEGEHVAGAWRLWRYETKLPPAGEYVVGTRASDDQGATQPLSRPPELAEAPYARNEVWARRLVVTC